MWEEMEVKIIIRKPLYQISHPSLPISANDALGDLLDNKYIIKSENSITHITANAKM
jgi:hypothetical protein